jgi:hypothetical protein
MRPAITLLITLSVIATMIALMGVMFKYLDVARDKAEVKASMIQANLLSADMGQMLRQILGKKPSKSTMKTLFETPLGLSAQSGEFAMTIACSPLANRVNITWLGLEGVGKKQKAFSLAQSLFEMLTDQVNLRDTALLREKILAEIKQTNSMVFGVSSRINKKKGIISFKKFQEILDDYRYEADDIRVYRIPWQKYFSFGISEQKIDGDFISSELLAFLYNVEINVVQEDFEMGELDNFLSEIGESRATYKWLFSEPKRPLPIAQCKASYRFRKGSYSFRFNYVDRRIEGFEFFSNQ